MKLVPRGVNIVLAGAWNPAILSPEWMLLEGLEVPKGQQHVVEALIPAGPGMASEHPRFTMPGFAYQCRPDALIMVPTEVTAAALKNVEAVVARIVGKLAHTPMAGLGHNFEFQDDAPEPTALEPFSKAQVDLVDAAVGWEAKGSRVLSSFGKGGKAVVNISRSWSGARLEVKFNFHYPITGSQEALQILTGESDRMVNNLESAKSIVSKLYGEIAA
jgi:hypothetical protein